ncbi:hypothetical protein ACN4EK_22335 [Pantanalinema rosaneae CENA516]|uniref:hypothetical protein n=1 Tax=Pantanalinema rosaneae TaxID=1620701 RepID=UPI003D6F0C6D
MDEVAVEPAIVSFPSQLLQVDHEMDAIDRTLALIKRLLWDIQLQEEQLQPSLPPDVESCLSLQVLSRRPEILVLFAFVIAMVIWDSYCEALANAAIDQPL